MLRSLALSSVILFLITGCHSKPSTEDLTNWLRDEHRELNSLLTLEEVTITDVETSGKPPVVNVKFNVIEKARTGLLQPVTLNEAYAHYGYDPAVYSAALKRLAGIRQPERSGALQKKPVDLVAAQLYRIAVRADEEITWNGSVTAEKRDGKWIFSGLTGAVDSSVLNEQTVPQTSLPADSVIVDGEAENRVTELIRQQKTFVEVVDNAEALMQVRLKREREFLLATIQSRAAWKVMVPVQNGPARQLTARFVHHENGGEKIFLLLEDFDDRRQRGVWTGTLKLTEPSKAESLQTAGRRWPVDGWVVSLVPRDKDGWTPRESGSEEILLTLVGDNQLFWANAPSTVTWLPEPTAVPLPDAETFRRQLLAGITPGQSWEGVIHYEGATAEQLRLTFTEFADEGNLVRLIVETPTDPFAIAVFEGTASLGPGEIHGWPLILSNTSGRQRRIGGELPALATNVGRTKLWLTLTQEGKLLGTSRSVTGSANELQLQPGNRIDPLQSSAERWHTALTAGSRWVGSITRGQQPAEKLTLIVIEVLEGGRILWLTAENPDNPHRHRVFQATLDSSRGIVDGYALSIEPRSMVGQPTDYDSLGRRQALFGAPDSYVDPKHLRLTLDGKKLLGVASASETFSVERQDAPVEKSLDLASRTALWRNACTTGTRWRGMLQNQKAGQSAEVSLHVTSGVDYLGNVAVEIALTKQRDVRMPLKGTLKLDHANANSFALTLQKQTAGKGNSRIFGSDTRIGVYFRLSNDGQQLIGMTTSPGNSNDEFMTLNLEE